MFAFVVSSSVSSSERRRKATNDHAPPYRAHSQYSIGADDDFQNHHSYPTAPSHSDNLPYNPHHEQEMVAACPTGYHHNHSGGAGIYCAGHIGSYPTGTVPPPHAYVPLLHPAPLGMSLKQFESESDFHSQR